MRGILVHHLLNDLLPNLGDIDNLLLVHNLLFVHNLLNRHLFLYDSLFFYYFGHLHCFFYYGLYGFFHDCWHFYGFLYDFLNGYLYNYGLFGFGLFFFHIEKHLAFSNVDFLVEDEFLDLVVEDLAFHGEFELLEIVV